MKDQNCCSLASNTKQKIFFVPGFWILLLNNLPGRVSAAIPPGSMACTETLVAILQQCCSSYGSASANLSSPNYYPSGSFLEETSAFFGGKCCVDLCAQYSELQHFLQRLPINSNEALNDFLIII